MAKKLWLFVVAFVAIGAAHAGAAVSEPAVRPTPCPTTSRLACVTLEQIRKAPTVYRIYDVCYRRASMTRNAAPPNIGTFTSPLPRLLSTSSRNTLIPPCEAQTTR